MLYDDLDASRYASSSEVFRIPRFIQDPNPDLGPKLHSDSKSRDDWDDEVTSIDFRSLGSSLCRRQFDMEDKAVYGCHIGQGSRL